MPDIATICCYCGCGCGLYLHVSGNRITGVSPSRNHPVSRGNLCAKGWQAHEFVHSADRLTRPLIRKNGSLQPASWQEALQLVASRFSQIIKDHSPDAIGVLSSAKCTNEENYLLQKFTRAVIGTNNIDHCARL